MDAGVVGAAMTMFRRGDRVEFTHPSYGVISGTVKSVNPRTVSVEDTSDGRQGWRVSPGVLRPSTAAPTTPTPSTGRRIEESSPRSTLRRGDRVEFTHPTHGVVSGTVKSVNRRSVTVEDTSDGRKGWRVTPDMLRPAGTSSPTTASATSAVAPPTRLSVGDTVEVAILDPWAKTATSVGVVTQVAPGRVELYVGGRTITDDGSRVARRPRRSEAEVMAAIVGVYNHLSPENLHADGLRSRSDAARLAATLNRALRALFVEAGRRVSEEEAYDWLERERAQGRI